MVMNRNSALTKRRETFGSVKAEGNEDNPGICGKCYDDGIEAKLVPYLIDGDVNRPDPDRRRCPKCSRIVELDQVQFQSELEDMVDVEAVNRPAKYVGISSRRIRSFKGKDLDLTQEVPNFMGGLEDKELSEWVADGAIITSIQDEGTDTEEY